MPILAAIFFRPALPPLLIAALAAAALVLSAIAYRRASSGSGAIRVALFAMRAIGVLAVASILLGPSYLPPTVEREVKPAVTVLVDVSESMRTADCGESPRIEALRSAWLSDAALDRLGAVAEVDLRLVGTFSERIGRAALSGLGPDAANAAASGLIEALGEAVDGVEPADDSHRILLLSDGRDTSGGTPTPMIEVARKRGVAIDTVCVGAAILRRDLLVQAAPTQDFLYANEEGGLLLRVQQVGVPVNTVDVELVVSGPEGEHTSSHSIDLRGTTIGELQVPIRHEKPGQYQYLVRVPTRPEELDTANNSQTLFIDVAKAKARVLMLEGLPSWDMKFIAQSLRKDPRVELTQVSRLSEKRTEVIRSGGEQGAKGDVARILAAESLAKIDVFILGAGVDRLLSPEVAAAIRDAVIERGAGVIHARGASYAADADSHATALAPIEPVDWDRSANATLKNRRIGLARSAGATPWLASDRLGVDLAALADRLPPWPIVRGGATPKPATIVLARAGAAGDAPSFADDEANPPAIATMRAGRGMSVMILGEGMWKWALVDHDRTLFQGMYERCWQGMVRWVASGGDARPGQDVTLRLAQQSATIGQSVGIEVLLDRAVAQPPSEVTITLPDGSSERVPLSRSSASELRLEGSFRPAGAGVHAVTLDAVDIEPARQQRFLSVFDPSVERVNTSADPAFMRLVAERTGGRVFDPADAGSYAEHVRKHRFSTIASNEAQWVWNRFPILLMLCVWLGLEWILRRKVGMP